MGQSSQEIEENIKRIQDRMSERVDHLADDLSLSSLASRTLGAKGNQPSDLLDAAIDTVRKHPLPAALIGAGLVGLLASQKSRANDVSTSVPEGNSYQPPAGFAETSPDAATRVASHVNTLKAEAGQTVAAAGDKLDSAKASATETMNNVAAGAKALASEQADKLKHAYSDARAGAEKGSAQIRQQTQHLGEQISAGGATMRRRAEDASGQIRDTSSKAADWAKENPVPLGLMALAFGAAAASFLTARSQSSAKHADGENLPESDVTPHHLPPHGSATQIDEPVARAVSAYDPPAQVAQKPKVKSKTPAKKTPSRKPSASSGAAAAKTVKSAAKIAAEKARSDGTNRAADSASIATGGNTKPSQTSSAKA